MKQQCAFCGDPIDPQGPWVGTPDGPYHFDCWIAETYVDPEEQEDPTVQ